MPHKAITYRRWLPCGLWGGGGVGYLRGGDGWYWRGCGTCFSCVSERFYHLVVLVSVRGSVLLVPIGCRGRRLEDSGGDAGYSLAPTRGEECYR